MFGQCFGSVIVSQCRNALSRNSSIHSGSFFFSTMSRMVSSVKPRGITSDSISVTNPYLYSCLAKSSAVLISTFLNSIISRLDALNLVQGRVDVRFRSQQLRKRDVGERVVDDLMQLDDHRTNTAITRVDARVKDARVPLAARFSGFALEDANHLVQVNLGRGSHERVTAFDSPSRLHQSRLGQNPHQLAGVRGRNAFEACKLSERQRLAHDFRAG